MTRGEIDLIPNEFKTRRKLSLNLGMHREITQKYLYKQIETDRSVQTVWCEYAWKLSVNSKGGILSYVVVGAGWRVHVILNILLIFLEIVRLLCVLFSFFHVLVR